MIRRFNYTGRIKIPKDRIRISLQKDMQGKSFTAEIDLKGLKIPETAKIYIEPNYKGVYQRFSFGTVGHIQTPENTRLNELPETELVFFDISIVDESGDIGLLLGKTNGIAVSTNELPGNRIPLLPVNTTDLKFEIWKLSFESGDEGRPVLELNNKIPDIQDKAKTDKNFIGLVYPAAFRQILERSILTEELESEDDTWPAQWIRFTKDFLGITYLPSKDPDSDTISPEQEEWITDCVNSFSKKLQLFEKYIS